MCKKFIVCSAVLAVCLSTADVLAEDGVYIDLSVLNALSTTEFSEPQFSSQPLFPEVKKVARPQVPSVKPKKARKSTRKKAKTVVNKVEVVEKVKPVKQEVVAPVIEEKTVEVQPSQIMENTESREVIAEVSNAPEKMPEVSGEDMPFQVETAPEVTENPLSSEVVPVEKGEELPPLTMTSEDKEEEASAPVSVEQSTDETQTQEEETSVPVVFEELTEETAEKQPEEEVPAPISVEQSTDETQTQEEVSAKEPTPLLPLISEQTEPELPVSQNRILFEDGVDELTETQKQLVDGIVRQFENPSKNKIMIMSYNYEDGKDSFKKKRISLNRAIEVRSYLLGQGYKNFSIKVINITDDSEKRNLVEIEELK